MKRENIVIHLPSEAYDKYYAMRNNDNSQYILFSIILIPVLVVCIENIKRTLLTTKIFMICLKTSFGLTQLSIDTNMLIMKK